MEATKITIHATISAGIQKVWNYYTQPEHITKWNFCIARLALSFGKQRHENWWKIHSPHGSKGWQLWI